MGIIISDINALMTNSVSNGDSGETHVNQKGNCAVSNIMYPNPLDTSFLTATFHFSIQIALGYRKQTVSWLDTIGHADQFLHLLTQKLRHGDGTITLFRLRSGNQGNTKLKEIAPMLNLLTPPDF